MMMVDRIKDWFVGSNRSERIWMMAKIEFKLRYYESKLGLIWALIKPIVDIFKFYLVFQILFGQQLENFAIYVFSGLVIWQFFVETTNGTLKLFKTKQYLFEYTNMDKLDIYFAYMISASLGLLINLGILFIGFLVTGIYPTGYYVYFPLIFLNLLILCLGASFILSCLYLLVKDIAQIWEMLIGVGFFLSPIFIRSDLFDKLPILLYLNPISGIIINTRNVLMYNQPPDWSLMIFDYTYALLILGMGLFTVKRLAPRASELL